jgi:hypothetical protein
MLCVAMLNLPAIRANGFAIIPLDSGPVPAVKFSGNGDTEAVAPLDRFLKLLHKTLIDEQRTSIAVDLGDLYFMNSSCLKAFVSWIYKVNTTGRPYQIRLQVNPRQSWQRRSLEPLKRLAPAVVFLDEWDEGRGDITAVKGASINATPPGTSARGGLPGQ